MTGNAAFTPLRVTAFVDTLGLGGVPWGLPTSWASTHEQRSMNPAGHDQQTDG